MNLQRALHDRLARLILAERRLHRYYRDGFDRVLRPPLVAAVQALIVARRGGARLGIAEEELLPGEDAATDEIVRLMGAFLRLHYTGRVAERAGNTKTYGVVRGQFEVLPGLAEHLRVGVLREARSYPAWVRFGGPGPLTPPDIEDNGLLSIGVKLMDVPGPKLLDDERSTQDFTGISAPTFTTPNVLENVKLQRHLLAGTPAFFFFNPFAPRDSHLLDGLMQFLYARAHHSPLEVPYYSCVPYLFGEGRAIQYAFRPRSPDRTPIPAHPSDNYLREAMAATLAAKEVSFDVLVQLQTDPGRMPVEDAGVRWPTRLSPYLPVARLRLPRQRFDSPAQLAFARRLSFNPWHGVPDHRPLGNQGRARRRIYLELSRRRQQMNAEPHLEPTGAETFED
ncbi:MAG TPA: hypothetical protein VGM69_25970 [Chloroflexota bacterium]